MSKLNWIKFKSNNYKKYKRHEKYKIIKIIYNKKTISKFNIF